jgi:glycosyltransferase involved in cell wall biosynthesis
VRVLVFHGYLLHGTGSNVYNARLGEALVRGGHELHLLCQDRELDSLPWVDGVHATVYQPDIGGLLPVYVADEYEGFDARPFPELSDAEVEAYIAANVAAVREVAERVSPDVALANHLVMGPVILARALGDDVPYAVKIHGSALEYVVKPHPRFLPYAREGLARARGILVGSRHTGESLWAALDDPGVKVRTRLGPPGVDVTAFAPREHKAARERLQALSARLASGAGASGSGSFARDASEGGRALAEADGRLVVFVGKLIASKGVELLLAAWPLVLAEHPDARLVIVGFGAWREGLEELARLLAAGDLEGARALRAEDGRELPELGAFLAAPPAEYPRLDRVSFTGRLEHAELADLLPAAEAIVAPSTFPEAFGMVAAEGAAAGALPVVARHSGLAEVSDALAEHIPAAARDWLSFAVGPDAVVDLARCLTGWLGASEDVRAATREAIVDVTRERWSWDGVARTVIAAAQGELDALPQP